MATLFGSSDKNEFIELFDLERDDLAEARNAASRSDFSSAAGHILKAVSERPMRAFNTPDEAAEIARLFAADYPAEVERLNRCCARLEEGGRRRWHECEGMTFTDHHDIDCEVRNMAGRGRGMVIFAFLHILTGNGVWMDRAMALMRSFPVLPMPYSLLSHYPNGGEEFTPVLPWHPNYQRRSPSVLTVAHILENLALALPLIWPGMSDAGRRFAAAYMADMSELSFQGLHDDPPYNIPLHSLVGALGTAALFPQLKNAPRWKAHMDIALSEGGAYVSLPYANPDGYFGEGFSYQHVNQTLLAKCLALYRRGFEEGLVPETLERQVAAGFEFTARSLKPDGTFFLLGDHGGRVSWEHEKDSHELLHLGAALFDRPDWKLRAGGIRGVLPHVMLPLMMGLDGYRRWREMPGPDLGTREHKSVFFPSARFAHLKTGAGRERCHHGMLTASLSHNHAHNDCLGIAVYGFGRGLISDSGGRKGGVPGRFDQPDEISAHAACRLGHLYPRGPRHENIRHSRMLAFDGSGCGRIQAAVAEHRLLEEHLQRRALLLFLPYGKPEGAFWVVWERTAHVATGDGGAPPFSPTSPAPKRVTETMFPLHCPGGTAKAEGLSGWSLHTMGDRLLNLDGEPLFGLTSKEASEAVEAGDSDANIQVTALQPQDGNAAIGLEVVKGYCFHFGFACARPVLSFKWRGLIPHEAAYVLIPFRGVAETEPFRVEGWSCDRSRPGAFEARLVLEGGGGVEVSASGFSGQEGANSVVRMNPPDGSEAVLEFPLRRSDDAGDVVPELVD